MKRVYHHVIGTTQYDGSCKFHLFLDCPQLAKKRVRKMAWGTQDSTGAIHTDNYEEVSDWRVCKLCLKREAR